MKMIHSYNSIIKTFKEVMNKVVGIITSVNSKSAGNEELLPTMIYCIIKSVPDNFLTAAKFLKLFAESSENKG